MTIHITTKWQAVFQARDIYDLDTPQRKMRYHNPLYSPSISPLNTSSNILVSSQFDDSREQAPMILLIFSMLHHDGMQVHGSACADPLLNFSTAAPRQISAREVARLRPSRPRFISIQSLELIGIALRWRPHRGRPSGIHYTYEEGLLEHLRGSVEADPCSHCGAGNRPFRDCVTLPTNNLSGACTNCRWGGQGINYSLRKSHYHSHTLRSMLTSLGIPLTFWVCMCRS